MPFDSRFIEITGIVVTALTLLFTIFVYFSSRNRTRISYTWLQSPLISVKDEVQHELTIFFRDEEIEDAALIILELANTGNTAIRSEDFYEKVSFGFGEEARILEAEIVDVVPEGLSVELRTEKGRVELAPLLLNKRDSISFKIVLSNFSGEIDTRGRVAGVKQIEGTYRLKFETHLTLWQQLRKVAVMFLGWLIGAFLTLIGTAILISEGIPFEGILNIFMGLSIWFTTIAGGIRGYENWIPPVMLVFLFVYVISVWVY